MYLISPEDKQVKKHLAREIHARQEKGQLNFQVKRSRIMYTTSRDDQWFTIRKIIFIPEL